MALLLAPTLAAADHVYSHRFVFEGRLVGRDGFPLPAAEVEFFAEGDAFEVPCEGGHEPITDQWGDFRFCFHKHELKASTMVGVRVGNLTERKIMDTAFRRTIVLMRDYERDGVEPPDWATTYRVAGKVWQPGATTLEDVPVFGLAVPRVPVNVTLTTTTGASTHTVETDDFGDFDAVLRLLPDVSTENATVRVETRGQVVDAALSPVFHRNTIGVRVPASPEFRAQTPDTTPDAGFQDAPGTNAPRLSAAVLVGVVVLAVAALVLRARQR